MTRDNEFALFVAVLAESDRLHPGLRGPLAPHELLQRAVAFRKLARTLQRFAVKTCNEGLTARETERQSSARDAACALAHLIGGNALTSGDPRGYVLELDLPTGRFNTWGGQEKGWGVPT